MRGVGCEEVATRFERKAFCATRGRCDSYYAAIRTATPDRIEALDMGRRSLHDEGSRILMERLRRKVEIDFDTARRLFTLVTVLHWKG